MSANVCGKKGSLNKNAILRLRVSRARRNVSDFSSSSHVKDEETTRKCFTSGHSVSQSVVKLELRRRRPSSLDRTFPCTGHCRSVCGNPHYCLMAPLLCVVSSRLSQGLGGAPFSRLYLASGIISEGDTRRERNGLCCHPSGL